jgi:hypothetical protein
MHDLGSKIDRLEKQLRRQRVLNRLGLLALALVALAGFADRTGDFDLVRTRGIVVVDDQGRERILIGAPIPKAKNRVRTDLDRFKASAFGQRFKGTDYKWFQGLNHDTEGMVVLDENGVDRLAIGHNVTDPIIGKRMRLG